MTAPIIKEPEPGDIDAVQEAIAALLVDVWLDRQHQDDQSSVSTKKAA